MSSAVAHLQPYIYTILSGPDVDLSRISAKRVRRQLVDGRSADAEFVRDNKDAVDALIADVFQRVSAERGFVPEVADEDEGEPPAAEEEGASEPVYEDDGGQGDGGSSPDPEPAPKKKKGRPPKTQKDDEAYARQLQAELNPPARASRSGSGGAPSKGGRKRKTKSSETVEDASDDDDGGRDEDDADAEVLPPKKKRRRAGAANGGAGDGEDGKEKKKRGGGGFQKPYQLSEPLVAVLNETVLPRGQVVKALWGYIKSHNLQNPSDKREILCDDKLRALFKLDKVTMFSMNKELSKHLIDPLANA